jgi:hypothetical protein
LEDLPRFLPGFGGDFFQFDPDGLRPAPDAVPFDMSNGFVVPVTEVILPMIGPRLPPELTLGP